MRTVEQDKQEVAEVIAQYRRGFATLDVATLTAMWDQSYDHIIYISLEAAHPIRGWAAVEQYYKRVARLLQAGAMTVRDVSVDVLGDVAYAFCTFHCEGELSGHPHTAEGRNMCILRRKNGVWKVIHYHESRPGSVEIGHEAEP
jgi:ketosteroid isomerase-like protein